MRLLSSGFEVGLNSCFREWQVFQGFEEDVICGKVLNILNRSVSLIYHLFRNGNIFSKKLYFFNKVYPPNLLNTDLSN